MVEDRRPAAETPPSALAVDIQGLRFAYPDGREALRGVDLSIAPGEKVALLGPNGAGKSTLLLHLNGLLQATSGTVRILGRDVTASKGRELQEIRALVGLVFQDPDDQLFSPTVFDDVAFGPIYMGLPGDEVERRVSEALDAVGLEGFGGRMPFHLSGGEKKRAALATVLSMRPQILALDEPAAGLDPRARRGIIRVLQSLEQTLLVTTHDMDLAREVFPRTVIMDEGVVATDGPTDSIFSQRDLLEAHALECP